MLDQRWKDLLRQPGALPALPEVLVRLQFGLYQLDVDIDELIVELQRDPALVAEVLRTINSALFGVPRRIESLKQAVVMLGLRRLRAIILSQSLRQSLATYQSPGFAAFRWWDRSMLNGIVAATLCQRTAPDLAEEAYLAGLVADVGILILARHERGYERILRASADQASADFAVASREQGGVDHAELAAEVFTLWRFPPMVVEAVRRHHDPTVMDEPAEFLLPKSVFFASSMTDYVVTRRRDIWDELVRLAESRFTMSREELDGLAATSHARYRDVAVPLGHRDFSGGDDAQALPA
ncbi:MAG: HDOD domain-containing protein [Phycisphaerae bacterium]|nr:HDOD domain-containing protein [Phycisphaerae bacterium]